MKTIFILSLLMISVAVSAQENCDSLDFYYSDSAAMHFGRVNKFGGWYRNGHQELNMVNLVKGKIYTECIAAGRKPVSNWRDAIFLMRATEKDVQYQVYAFPYLEESPFDKDSFPWPKIKIDMNPYPLSGGTNTYLTTIKDTTSPFIIVKHPGKLFDADRVNEMVVLGAIAVDSVRHGKRDTLFIKGKQYLWIEDKSKRVHIKSR